jgi:cytochrome c oxidase subunit 3
MESAYTEEEKLRVRKKTAKALLWVGIASIVMLFAGFTSAYIVRQSEGNWLQFDLPNAFYVSTALIILSSLTMVWASFAAKRNDQKGLFTGLVVTFILGIGFIYSQFTGYDQLVDMGIYVFGSKSNPAGSFVYIISIVHIAHLVGGLIALAFTTFQAWRGKYDSENKLGVELCATYWHFIDVLWVYLFLFLLYIR